MLDFVNTNTFRDIADFVIFPGDGKNWTTNILKQNSIIYTQIGPSLKLLFDNIRFSNRKYILITHASDFVDKRLFDSKPACIKKWFAEYSNYDHPDLIPIPIGLSPHKDSDKGGWDVEWFTQDATIEKLRNNPKDTRTIYCTWNYINNPPKRTGILKILRDNNIKYIWDRFGAEEGEGHYKNWKDYCDTSSRYKFSISPEGNGFDSHRTWDALYMGCFPIVLKHPTFKCASNLPLIQINNWNELTYDLLDSYLDKEYNMEQLNMSYWTKYIHEEFYKL